MVRCPEIIGVIGDINSRPREAPQARCLSSDAPDSGPGCLLPNVQIRIKRDAASLGWPSPSMTNQIDDKMPVFGVTTMDEQIREKLTQERTIAQLVSFFGTLALILAFTGLYGVMAHGVARRTNEIGIRMALGAQGGNIAWMVLRETLLLVLVGLAIGQLAALLAVALFSSLLFYLESD